MGTVNAEEPEHSLGRGQVGVGLGKNWRKQATRLDPPDGTSNNVMWHQIVRGGCPWKT
jgi:hypothetical protein